MKLLTLGCSFTYGDELDDRMTQSWPSQLCKVNGWDLVNLAKSGGSNDRIIRTLLEEIDKEYDIVIIAWTYIERFMIKDGDIGQGWNGEGITTSAGPKWNNEPNFSWAVNYFKYAQDLDFDYQKYLQNVVLIQEFLKSRNQKYLFVNTFDMWTDLYPNAQARIARNSHLVDQIDQDYFLGWPTEGILTWQGDCPKGPGGHPLELGHQRIAETINEYIRNIGWVS